MAKQDDVGGIDCLFVVVLAGILLIGPGPSAVPDQQSAVSPAASSAAAASVAEVIAPSPPKLSNAERQRIQAYVEKQMPKLQNALPALPGKLWEILKKSIGGFLGATSFLLSLILVPVYLFFLLKEKPHIEQRWTDYLPLRASPLKNEAVLIAAFPWGDWTHPIVVTAIFIFIQNLEGLFYAPRIVGNYVWITSDDSDRVDLCLGSDHWRSHWAAPCCAAYCYAEGAFRTLRLGQAFARPVLSRSKPL